MFAIFVNIQVAPAHRKEFMEASLGDGHGSVRDEPGCFRFDILQSAEDENRFHLYEVYADEAAFEAHQQTPHFKKWIETVRDWFVGELEITRMSTIFPSDEGWRKQKPHLLHW
jgi:autoinducer 2-degrading protein